MMNNVTTLTQFILNEEKQVRNATGSFTILMTQIENAAKIIASHVKESGLVDILGKTGEVNAYQEEVQKLDKFSNHLIADSLTNSHQVYAFASEELNDFVKTNNSAAKYVVFFDPLDGSSNIDVNINVGTIFSIYKKNSDLLQLGLKQIASGYIIYGSSVMFVYSFGRGVNGFTLDPSIGSFLLSHPNIRIPESGATYSINEGYYELFDDRLKRYLNNLKVGDKPYKARYVGSGVADVHRTLLKGGIFIYPADKKHPDGKLRLMFEVNPWSFIIEQAGGAAVSRGKNPLTIKPEKLEQRVPIALGSKREVEKYMKTVGQ